MAFQKGLAREKQFLFLPKLPLCLFHLLSESEIFANTWHAFWQLSCFALWG